MAPEAKFELLDQYLSGKMSPEEQAAFEQQLQSDPTLQKELAFQKEIIEGIRRARVAELKAMLNNVPVPPANPLASGTVMKIVSSVLAVSAISTVLYFYLNQEKENTPAAAQQTVSATNHTDRDNQTTTNPEPKSQTPVPEQEDGQALEDKAVAKETPAGKKQPAGTSPQPNLQVYIPETEETNEREQLESHHARIVESGFVTSSIEVERSNNTGYPFHYAFRNRKLILYGNFEDNLYEILEFLSGQERTVVLYYKGYYYLLDTGKEEPEPLVPIINKALLQKLKRYRKK